jgi:glutamate synthase (NADPH/NADH) small chain
MGRPSGFLEHERLKTRYRPVAERLGDWHEIPLQPAAEELAAEGARCMDCGAPYCHYLGCPLANLIPEWNDSVYKARWYEAWLRLEMTNPLPEITGRVCPAPCEPSCTLSVNSSPVAIKQLELAIIERAFAEGWVRPSPPRRETGRKVAVIGSGPSGLAAAQLLRRRGHMVSLFEKSGRPGGLLRYGIPDFKLDKGVLDRRLAQMAAEGVEFETGVVVGEDLSVRYLQKKYDALLLCLGAGQPRDLSVPGRGYEGIHFAMEYLAPANQVVARELTREQAISAHGKRVLVVGGGDTGSDCVGTALRQGARSVHQVEILPRPRTWEAPTNPEWPRWPNILRSSTSHEEGSTREWAVTVTQFSGGYDPWVQQAHLTRVEWKPGRSGRPEPVEVPGSEYSLGVDLVLLAMGFLHVEHGRLLDALGVELDTRGNLAVDEAFRTSRPGIFACGDAVRGASLVVSAIAQGRQAAEVLDRLLTP